MVRNIFLLVLNLLLLVSCGNNFYLFQDQELWSLSTIFPGQWLSEEDFIPLEIREPTELEESDQIGLRLRRKGNTYYQYQGSLSGIDGFAIPSGLVDGEYSLEYDIRRNEKILGDYSLPFFIHSANYGLQEIKLFPPLIREGEQVLAQVNLVNPDESIRPWLIWKMDDEILYQGYLDRQQGFVEFIVPEKTGVYPLEVEIFPEEPRLWEGASPYKVSTEIFVTHSDMTLNQPVQDEHYILYAMFDGSRDFHSLSSQKLALQLRDQYMLGDYHKNGLKGKHFSEESFIRFDGLALPVVDGQLVSHTHNFYFQLDESEPEQRETLFSTKSPGDGTSLTINRVGRELVASFGKNNRYHRLRLYLEEFQLHRPLMLSLSLSVNDDQMIMEAYLDGQYAGGTLWKDRSDMAVVQGETLLGALSGTPGFQGSLYSWMIYTREIPLEEGSRFLSQDDIFEWVKNLHWGERLVMAEGFDDSELAEGLSLNKENYLPVGSKLFLNDGDILRYQGLSFSEGHYQIELEGLFPDPPLCRLILDDGNVLLLPVFQQSIQFKIEKRGIYLYHGEGIWELEASGTIPDGSPVILEIQAENTTTLDSIFIHR